MDTRHMTLLKFKCMKQILNACFDMFRSNFYFKSVYLINMCLFICFVGVSTMNVICKLQPSTWLPYSFVFMSCFVITKKGEFSLIFAISCCNVQITKRSWRKFWIEGNFRWRSIYWRYLNILRCSPVEPDSRQV